MKLRPYPSTATRKQLFNCESTTTLHIHHHGWLLTYQTSYWRSIISRLRIYLHGLIDHRYHETLGVLLLMMLLLCRMGLVVVEDGLVVVMV